MFEPIFEIHEYYDGLREGIGSCQGSRSHFRSLMLDVMGDEPDLFEVTFLEGPQSGTKVRASAIFQRIGSGALQPGQWPQMEVSWHIQASAA